MKFHIIILLIIGVLTSSSCNNSQKGQEEEENTQISSPVEATDVQVIPLETRAFTQELISNGKISAQKMAELYFQSPKEIKRIFVKNGDRVKKGDLIASLNTFTFENELQRAKDELERSELDLQDMLIGQGYDLKDIDSVPVDMIRLIKVKSGYSRAANQYELAEFNRDQAVLRAPINGVIANLSSKVNNIANTSKAFCNIIDLNSMEAEFSILENELGLIKKGARIKALPYSMADVEVEGRISEINPWVDENGMVEVKAIINYHPRMIEGMSVKLHVFRFMEKQWVVPKTAIVLRASKQVVFVYQDGKAIWNYVTTGLENVTEYSITSETLKEGDQIIISENINLAHESPVNIIEP